MSATPELIDLVTRIDDLDFLRDPSCVPTVDGLAVTAAEMALLSSATIDDVLDAARESIGRREWTAHALDKAADSFRAAMDIIKPHWQQHPGMKMGQLLEVIPAADAAQVQAHMREHGFWNTAAGLESPTEEDLNEGWLDGKYQRVELNDNDECVRWRRITIIDPAIATGRARIAAEYRKARDRIAEMVHEVAEQNPKATADELVDLFNDTYGEEGARLTITTDLAEETLDKIDATYGVPVDDAGMPTEGA